MNAPAAFQTLMNDIFWPYLWKFVCFFFFNDILVYSSAKEEHLRHLQMTPDICVVINCLLKNQNVVLDKYGLSIWGTSSLKKG